MSQVGHFFIASDFEGTTLSICSPLVEVQWYGLCAFGTEYKNCIASREIPLAVTIQYI